MPSKPARTSIAAILASTLLLAGCSGDSDKDADKDAPSSQESSQDGTDSSPTESGTSAGQPGGGELEKDEFFEEILEAQQEAGSYKTTSTISNAGVDIVLEGEAVYEGDELSAHSKTTPQSAQQVESVLAGGIIYLRGDGLGPAGKWVKIDPEDPATASSPFGALGSLADPEKALAALDDPKELTLVGSETVEDTETSHYRVVATSASYVDALDLPPEVAQAMPEELTFDIWLDDENRTIKLYQEVEIQGQTSVTEQVYSDYGSPVSVDVPADSDTVGIDALS